MPEFITPRARSGDADLTASGIVMLAFSHEIWTRTGRLRTSCGVSRLCAKHISVSELDSIGSAQPFNRARTVWGSGCPRYVNKAPR